jgi:tetratricopeptide (TPR) repeat protein
VKFLLTPFLRRVYWLVVLVGLGYCSVQFARHSGWYKQRLYQRLLTGNRDQKLEAAGGLAAYGGQKQLLAALKSDSEDIRELASRGLNFIWFHASGEQAYQMVEAAYAATEKKNYAEALAIADRLVVQYPDFAEGWNRRGAIHWQMGSYEKSLADCAKALALNPNHYGAWQGAGICQLELGDLTAAVRSLRAALKIIPHDSATRASLRKCEDLLRQKPGPGRVPPREEFI